MKIVFVYPNLTRLERVTLGLAYVASRVQERGHECHLVDYTWGGGYEKTLDKIRVTGAKIVGLSVKSGEVDFCIDLSRKLKEELGCTIIWGGVHPSIDPEKTITLDCVDMICIGEGEEATAELLDTLEQNQLNTTIRNIWFKKNGEIIRNPIRTLTQNLDNLKFPDRDLHDTQLYIEQSGTVDLIAGRGCPYQCSYCVEPTYAELFKGNGAFVRYRSVENVLDDRSWISAGASDDSAAGLTLSAPRTYLLSATIGF